ncbi:ABC transporter ATP-binding protein [Treponema denticola]|uniref:ABC transporter ATP-binding protein n=1 Tax=Treponema denticola TaxID=158 RepID=UPI0020A46BFB|nr:ABC transporter ATP-binding protein [Treponema denticola]UTC98752.1 ABC transporter ATP-binding protein [Treponema denticola]
MKPTNTAKPEMKLSMPAVKRLLSYLKQYKTVLAVVTVCILLSAGATASAALFLQVLIDRYIMPLLAQSTPVFSGLLRVLIFMAAIYGTGVLCSWIYNRLMIKVAQQTLKRIRDEMFSKMQRFPLRYFDTHTHGDIMSRYTNDTDTLRQMITQSMPQLVSSMCTVVTVFFAMLYQSVYLTIIVVASIFSILKVIKFVAKKSGFYFVRQQETLGQLNGYVEEMINGQKVIKVFCREEAVKADFHEKNAAWQESASKANSYANIIMPFMNALGYFQYVIVALVGAWFAIAKIPNPTIAGINTLTLGTIASFLTLSRNFTNPISQLSNQLNSVINAVAGASRIFALMDEEPEEDAGTVTLVNAREEAGTLTEAAEHTGVWAWKEKHEDGSITLTRLTGKVIFEHVDFGYSPDKKVLKDINLFAERGQKVAFVGATGAGKTTITNLINRFYDINKGTITYDGIPITRIKKEDLRRSLGIVLQEVNLFTGSIMENIRFGNLDATDEQCIEAAKLANAHNFITMLPHGYDTVIEGNKNSLSQGQRQLLSIARAAVSDPPVMILDEATSSIDTRTEALIQKGMDSLMEGRTVFVIAHRLSTVMNSDVIMVLDHGEIIERGTHASLLEKKGVYYQLYTGALDFDK